MPSREALAEIAGLKRYEGAAALFETVKAYRDYLDQAIEDGAKISDELREDYRWLMGMKEACNAILSLPEAAVQVLQNEENRK